jgi:hypothetical protein
MVALTSDTEQGVAAQTSEADRVPIPMRLAVQCQGPGQCRNLTLELRNSDDHRDSSM